MLIDARHPEETRVAVVNGQRIEEFDFEAADRKQLKGNIYLAKVTRVEPSLQAAFVEYGGNRHGFLAFSEIHPDYYQIPREDREALLREEAEFAAENDDHQDDELDENGEPRDEVLETGGQSDEPTDALRRKRQSLRRRYKIQEVIHRRQVLLIQVVKEERGSKGAALTTYLSLAGRYCVLMPNTAHGGGISRKISNIADRKRLKAIMADLKLPTGMGAIVRTAGLKRSSDDIRRDFDYLTRLWDEIREKTLASSAPALIHQDSDLIKRAIRDIYHRDIDQVLVEGPEGFADASRFMSMLMPGHTPKVVEYSDNVPLFQRFGVEQQLEGMYQPVVQLKSGGYIVINPTEALVSIDINSGRSTREYGIEETATKTNLEAAEEIGRQLRLRDMAGLVVIDFIDMEVGANNRRVEKAMKDALRHDRARVQIGRISAFGLLEMSRQRLRTGILEASTHICPMCEGTGMVRSVASAALAALRALEAEALRGRASDFTLRAGDEVAVYILNRKRIELAELEELYGVTIVTVPDESLIGPNFAIDAGGPPPTKKVEMRALPVPVRIEDDPDDDIAEGDDEAGEDRPQGERAERGDRNERGGRNKRRRRGGRNGREEGSADAPVDEGGDAPADVEDDVEVVAKADESPAEIEARGNRERSDRKRRRRGRRGKRDGAPVTETGETAAAVPAAAAEVPVAESPAADAVEAAPKPKRSRRRKADVEGVPDLAAAEVAEAQAEEPAAAPEPAEDVADAVAEPKAKGSRKRPSKTRAAPAAAAPAAKPAAKAKAAAAPAAVTVAPEPVAEAKPKRAPRKAKAEAATPEVAPATKATEADPVPVKPKRRAKAATTPEAVAAPVPDAPAEAAPAAEPATPDATDAGSTGPARKGWWQRTFG
ncbi:Rne/Rng family ribonuclease [Polymorphobacter fuscus]|uniref:Ribonuclease E n=2 Tax=Sandarakinorhabdus fusca TaxID=1439888 RepID=A0A7C9GPD6_9SPHN|nr:Rne/Rng family ribonuclease [Polymorphobacter fuscus]MQT16856.1 Rne/Rng family ribonuclease [Polymorphobacter fuscus]